MVKKKRKAPLEEVKGFTIGQLAALVHRLGGQEAAWAVLEYNDLAKHIAEIIVKATKGDPLLYQPNPPMTANEVLADMDARGLRPATAKELVAKKSAKKHVGFPVTYDQSIGLVELIKRAVGEKNCNNIDTDITPERFPLKGTDVRMANVRVKPFLLGESCIIAANRLVTSGHILANTGDLIGFLTSYPEEVNKWDWVAALSKDSRWTDPDGGEILVPIACHVFGSCLFGLQRFREDPYDGLEQGANFDGFEQYCRDYFSARRGILVLCE